MKLGGRFWSTKSHTPIAFSCETGPKSGATQRIRSEKFIEGTDTLLSRCVFLIKIIDLEQILPDEILKASKSMILIKKTHRERSVSVPSGYFSLLNRCGAPFSGPVRYEFSMGVSIFVLQNRSLIIILGTRHPCLSTISVAL